MEYFASVLPEIAKLSPFLTLLAIWAIVLWKQFLKKDAAMTQQMVDNQKQILALTERTIVAQEQNTQAYQKMSVSLDRNTQAVERLSTTIDDNQDAVMKKLDQLDTKPVRPLHRQKQTVEPKAQA